MPVYTGLVVLVMFTGLIGLFGLFFWLFIITAAFVLVDLARWHTWPGWFWKALSNPKTRTNVATGLVTSAGFTAAWFLNDLTGAYLAGMVDRAVSPIFRFILGGH
jgi:hypothetical protein